MTVKIRRIKIYLRWELFRKIYVAKPLLPAHLQIFFVFSYGHLILIYIKGIQMKLMSWFFIHTKIFSSFTIHGAIRAYYKFTCWYQDHPLIGPALRWHDSPCCEKNPCRR